LHPGTGATFDFPQNNGDIFAFTSLANQKFQHGVPKANTKVGPRFSIIAWGRRRTINERNSGLDEQEEQSLREKEDQEERVEMRSSSELKASSEIKSSQEIPNSEEKKEIVIEVDEVVRVVKEWVAQQEAKKKPATTTTSASRGGTRGGRSRVQGGWSGGRGGASGGNSRGGSSNRGTNTGRGK
jgi:hypothetical protein